MSERRVSRQWWLVVVVGVAILFVPVVRGALGTAARWTVRPVTRNAEWIGDQLRLRPSNNDLARERLSLRQQITALNQQLQTTRQTLETIQSAVALAAYQQESKHQLLSAHILARSPDPGIQSIVIDRGSSDGVLTGQAVVAEQGSVIGKVVTVHQVESTVLLLVDGQSVIGARIGNDQHSPGVVKGERGLSLRMELVPKHDQVQTGQTVVTNGTESLIPSDLLIGSVQRIYSRSGDLFQQAVVLPTVDVTQVRSVAVVLR